MNIGTRKRYIQCRLSSSQMYNFINFINIILKAIYIYVIYFLYKNIQCLKFRDVKTQNIELFGFVFVVSVIMAMY